MPKKYVVEDNDVLLSCELPSHVADFLRVTAWLDSEGHELGHGAQGIACYSPMLGGGGEGHWRCPFWGPSHLFKSY